MAFLSDLQLVIEERERREAGLAPTPTPVPQPPTGIERRVPPVEVAVPPLGIERQLSPFMQQLEQAKDEAEGITRVLPSGAPPVLEPPLPQVRAELPPRPDGGPIAEEAPGVAALRARGALPALPQPIEVAPSVELGAGPAAQPMAAELPLPPEEVPPPAEEAVVPELQGRAPRDEDAEATGDTLPDEPQATKRTFAQAASNFWRGRSVGQDIPGLGALNELNPLAATQVRFQETGARRRLAGGLDGYLASLEQLRSREDEDVAESEQLSSPLGRAALARNPDLLRGLKAPALELDSFGAGTTLDRLSAGARRSTFFPKDWGDKQIAQHLFEADKAFLQEREALTSSDVTIAAKIFEGVTQMPRYMLMLNPMATPLLAIEGYARYGERRAPKIQFIGDEVRVDPPTEAKWRSLWKSQAGLVAEALIERYTGKSLNWLGNVTGIKKVTSRLAQKGMSKVGANRAAQTAGKVLNKLKPKGTLAANIQATRKVTGLGSVPEEVFEELVEGWKEGLLNERNSGAELGERLMNNTAEWGQSLPTLVPIMVISTGLQGGPARIAAVRQEKQRAKAIQEAYAANDVPVSEAEALGLIRQADSLVDPRISEGETLINRSQALRVAGQAERADTMRNEGRRMIAEGRRGIRQQAADLMIGFRDTHMPEFREQTERARSDAEAEGVTPEEITDREQAALPADAPFSSVAVEARERREEALSGVEELAPVPAPIEPEVAPEAMVEASLEEINQAIELLDAGDFEGASELLSGSPLLAEAQMVPVTPPEGRGEVFEPSVAPQRFETNPEAEQFGRRFLNDDNAISFFEGRADEFGEQAQASLTAGDFEAAAQSAVQGQFWREASSVAAGKGLTEEILAASRLEAEREGLPRDRPIVTARPEGPEIEPGRVAERGPEDFGRVPVAEVRPPPAPTPAREAPTVAEPTAVGIEAPALALVPPTQADLTGFVEREQLSLDLQPRAVEDLTQAQETISAASTDPYAEAARALERPEDVEALRGAFARGDVVSSIITALVKNEIQAFDVRGHTVHTPRDFAALLAPLRSPYFESMKIAYLDADMRVIDSRVLTVGILDASLIHPREALRNVPDGTDSVILAHNHPSGDPAPSAEDIRISRTMVKPLQAAGVPVRDHVITNGGKYVSLREAGIVEFTDRPPTGVVRTSEKDLPENPVTAEWEALGRDLLRPIRAPEELTPISAALRQANPNFGHIIYLTGKNRITAIERIPLDLPKAEREERISRGVGREGAAAYLIDWPSQLEGDALLVGQGAIALAESLDVHPLDIASRENRSLRESGTLTFREERERAPFPEVREERPRAPVPETEGELIEPTATPEFQQQLTDAARLEKDEFIEKHLSASETRGGLAQMWDDVQARISGLTGRMPAAAAPAQRLRGRKVTTAADALRSAVLDLGGIRQFKKDPETGRVPFAEEMGKLPARFRRRNGLPLDRMLEELKRDNLIDPTATESDLIDSLVGTREIISQERFEEEQAEAAAVRAGESDQITASELEIGDKFTIEGEQFEVVDETDQALELKGDEATRFLPFVGDPLEIDAGSLERRFPVAPPVIPAVEEIRKKLGIASDKRREEEQRQRITRRFKRAIRDERADIQQKQRLIKQYIEATLPLSERGKALTKIEQVARFAQPATRERFVERTLKIIDETAAKAEQNILRRRVVDRIDKERKFLKRARQRGKKAELGLEHADKLAEYLQSVTVIPKQREAKLRRAAEFFTNNPQEEMPNALRDEMQELLQPNVRDMSMQELKDVLDNIVTIKQTGRFKWQVAEAERKEKLDASAGVAASAIRRAGQIEEIPPPLVKAHELTVGQRGVRGRLRNMERMAKRFGWGVIRPERVAWWMEGFDPARPFWSQTFKKGIDAEMEELTGKEEALKTFGDLFKDVDMNEAYQRPIITLELEEDSVPLTLTEAMFIYAHSQSEGGMSHLRGTGITEEMTRDVERGIPQKAKDAVQAWFEYARDVQYPKLNEIFRREHHVDMPRVENYMRIENIETDRAENALVADLLARHSTKNAPAVEKGFTIQRVNSTAPFRQMDFFSTVARNMMDTEHYVAWNQPAREISEFLRQPSVREAMNARSEAATKDFQEWLRAAALGKQRRAENPIDALSDTLRLNVVGSILGANIISIGVQPVSFLTGMRRLDNKVNAVRSLQNFLQKPIETNRRVNELSTAMRNRGRFVEREFAEQFEKTEVQRWVKRLPNKDKIRETLLSAQRATDRLTTVVLWDAKFKESLEKNEDRENAQEIAVDEADELIRTTQPAGGIINLPPLLRGGGIARAFTAFTNQINQNANLIFETGANYRGLWSSVQDLFFFMIASGTMVSLLRKRRLPQNARQWADAFVGQFAGAFPVVGQLLRGATGLLFGADRDDWWKGDVTPVTFRPIEDLTKGLMRRDLGKVVDGLAAAVGIPGYTQAKRTFRGIDSFRETGDPSFLIWSESALQGEPAPTALREVGELREIQEVR